MRELIQKVPNAVQRGVEFFKEAWRELRRVYWPSLRETYAATFVVLIVVLMMALFMALVDFGLTRAIQVILS